jgi:hypothetical protein
VAGEAGEKFLAKGGSFLPGHRLGFAVVIGMQAAGDNFEGARGDSEQRFALEKILKITVEDGVDLQAVAAVFDDIGIHEAGDRAFAEEGFAEALGKKRSQVAGG